MYFTIHTHLANNLSQIVSHHKSLYSAKESLVEASKAYVHDLYGRLFADHIQSISYPHALDVKGIQSYLAEQGTQAEIVLVASEADIQKVYLYKKQATTDAGWIYNSTKFTYQPISIFQVVEYNLSVEPSNMEFVQRGCISVPKVMTVAPMAEVMQDLIKSKRFLAQKSKYD